MLNDDIYILNKQNNLEKVAANKLTKMGTGGTATVYALLDDGNEKALKLYNQATLDKHAGEYKKKLQAMLENPPQNVTFKQKGKRFIQFTWPEALLVTKEKNLLGYVMPALPEDEVFQLTNYIRHINNLYDSNTPDQEKKHLRIDFRIQVALNLAVAIEELHKAGHYFIDMKTDNIFVFKETSTICFIDCDGFAIEKGKYKAEHFSKSYIVPDAIRHNQSPTFLSDKPYQDFYSLAHLIFEILNYGTQPFQGVPTNADLLPNTGDTYDFKVKKGWYPYGKTINKYIKPYEYALYQFLPNSMLTLFEKAFTGKNHEIPSASDWKTELKSHIDNVNFEKCKKHPDNRMHIHFKGTGCFVCDVFEGQNNPNLNTHDDIPLPPLPETVKTEVIKTNQQRSNALNLTARQNRKLKSVVEWARNSKVPESSIPSDTTELYKKHLISLNNLELDSLPDELIVLENLKHVQLRNNNFDTVPKVLIQMTSLETITLANNNITKLPDNVAQSDLNKFKFDGNPVAQSENTDQEKESSGAIWGVILILIIVGILAML